VAEQGEDGVEVLGSWPDLVALCARASPISMSHWNPATGELFELPRGKARRAQAEAFEQRLWASDAWVEVPCQESDDAFAHARAFVAGLAPGRGKATLGHALDEAKPFRAFRAAIAAMPGLRRRWDAALAAEAEQRLAGFCLAHGWRIADRRFDDAVARWLDDRPDRDADPPPAAVAVRRGVAALSIGRPRGSA